MMAQDQWTAVDDYFTELLVKPFRPLDGVQEACNAAGLPAISVSPPQGKFLNMLAHIRGARSILEIGTLGGYSTIWLGYGMARDGRLITLESDPKHAEVATANIARAGLADRVEVRCGLAIDSLRQINNAKEGPFDLIFIDADKPSIPDYFWWALKLARLGAIIIVDNVVREGEVVDADSKDASVQGVRRFMDMLSGESRVTATAIQTVGIKGYDGFAMGVVLGT
jgi:predicted O-methyltransferase YrrM